MRKAILVVLAVLIVGAVGTAMSIPGGFPPPSSEERAGWIKAIQEIDKVLFGYEDQYGAHIIGLEGELTQLVTEKILKLRGPDLAGLDPEIIITKKFDVEGGLEEVGEILPKIIDLLGGGFCPGGITALFAELDQLMVLLRSIDMTLISLKGELENALWKSIVLSDTNPDALDRRITHLEMLREAQELLIKKLEAYTIVMEVKLGIIQHVLRGTVLGISIGSAQDLPSARPDVRVKLKGPIIASGSDEVVTVENFGAVDADLTDWKVVSVDRKTGAVKQTFTFPEDYILSVGAEVRIHSGPSAKDNPPFDLFWTRAYVWDERRARPSCWTLMVGKGPLLSITS